ncbi:MAG TPA: hypothetical protein VG268_17335 [Streptosporangiaceae bacterium]|jgi:hypothetical protein|nr:hypothetical protein [Streptosporangiaceae bacterium]
MVIINERRLAHAVAMELQARLPAGQQRAPVLVPPVRGRDFIAACRRPAGQWRASHLAGGDRPMLVALCEDGLLDDLDRLGFPAYVAVPPGRCGAGPHRLRGAPTVLVPATTARQFVGAVIGHCVASMPAPAIGIAGPVRPARARHRAAGAPGPVWRLAMAGGAGIAVAALASAGLSPGSPAAHPSGVPLSSGQHPAWWPATQTAAIPSSGLAVVPSPGPAVVPPAHLTAALQSVPRGSAPQSVTPPPAGNSGGPVVPSAVQGFLESHSLDWAEDCMRGAAGAAAGAQAEGRGLGGAANAVAGCVEGAILKQIPAIYPKFQFQTAAPVNASQWVSAEAQQIDTSLIWGMVLGTTLHVARNLFSEQKAPWKGLGFAGCVISGISGMLKTGLHNQDALNRGPGSVQDQIQAGKDIGVAAAGTALAIKLGLCGHEPPHPPPGALHFPKPEPVPPGPAPYQAAPGRPVPAPGVPASRMPRPARQFPLPALPRPAVGQPLAPGVPVPQPAQYPVQQSGMPVTEVTPAQPAGLAQPGTPGLAMSSPASSASPATSPVVSPSEQFSPSVSPNEPFAPGVNPGGPFIGTVPAQAQPPAEAGGQLPAEYQNQPNTSLTAPGQPPAEVPGTQTPGQPIQSPAPADGSPPADVPVPVDAPLVGNPVPGGAPLPAGEVMGGTGGVPSTNFVPPPSAPSDTPVTGSTLDNLANTLKSGASDVGGAVEQGYQNAAGWLAQYGLGPGANNPASTPGDAPPDAPPVDAPPVELPVAPLADQAPLNEAGPGAAGTGGTGGGTTTPGGGTGAGTTTPSGGPTGSGPTSSGGLGVIGTGDGTGGGVGPGGGGLAGMGGPTFTPQAAPADGTTGVGPADPAGGATGGGTTSVVAPASPAGGGSGGGS